MPLLNSGGMIDQDDDTRFGSSANQRELRFSQSKLKAASNTSALLVGFAMVALVEFELRSPGRVEQAIGNGWLIAFAICTCLLISVHLVALIMSVCILPQMEYMTAGIDPRDQPHHRFRWFIEVGWILSTVFGLLLFLLEVSVMCLIKFGAIDNMTASWSAISVLGLAMVAFLLFVHYFYRTLYRQKISVMSDRVRELEKSYESLDRISCEKGMCHSNKGSGTIFLQVPGTNFSSNTHSV